MVTDVNADAAVVTQSDEQASDDSGLVWMLRSLLIGVLLIGSANAISFFFRSSGWGSLLGNRDSSDEAIGFPLMIWEESTGYSTHALRGIPFLVDISTALLVGGLIGLLAIWKRRTLNQIMDRFRTHSTASHVRLQFSLRGLLITTVLAAIAAAAVRSFSPRVEVLAGIYALGPLVLVALAFAPRRLSWQQRVTILMPMAVMLIAAAIALGNVLEIEFDKVMMGIFICWTPQSAIAAICLITWLLLKEYRAMKVTPD